MRVHLRYSVFLLVFLLLGGCAGRLPEVSGTQEERLSKLISSMDSSINKKEASEVAHEAIFYSRKLAQRYKVQTSPWIHNFLVNVGLKKRGLCYQWADDLISHLDSLHLRTLKFVPIGANIGDYWREHNAVAVLPAYAHIPLSQAIMLDAWRHSGNLYFALISQDIKYRWKVRTDRLQSIKQ